MTSTSFVTDNLDVEFTVQIRKIFANISAALPPATPATQTKANVCEKGLHMFDLAMAIPNPAAAV